MSLKQTPECLLREESTLLHHLSPVCSQLNELAPISNLPPELLTYIFSLCTIHPYSRSLSKPVPSTTLILTQVCRAWRTLAGSLPFLWSIIDICHNDFASLFLSRCGESDISLVAPTPRIAFDGSLVPVQNQIRKIILVLSPDAMLRLFKGLMMGLDTMEGGSGLESEERLMLENLVELDLRLPSIAEHLDLSFLDLPSVHTISLDDVNLDWGALARGNRSGKLKSLSLSRLIFEMDELLGLIAQSEEVLLEAIHVKNNAPCEIGNIAIPTLRKITISTTDKGFVDGLLSRITLAKDTAIVVRCLDMQVSLMGHQIPDALAAAFQQQRTAHSNLIGGNMGISSDIFEMMGL